MAPAASPLPAGEGWVRESPTLQPTRPHRHSRPRRHSRESGNPHPALSIRQAPPGFWIPAYAGMTVGVGLRIARSLRRGASRQPSPSGRGLGEGESDSTTNPPPPSFPSPPSFPRKRESTPRPIPTPRPTGVLDSGLRRNDGGGEMRAVRAAGVWGESPQPPFCERGAFGGFAYRHSARPRRHSGVGRNPEPRRWPRQYREGGVWIPAFAGMTVRGGNDGGGRE